jgi:hypothetical protein
LLILYVFAYWMLAKPATVAGAHGFPDTEAENDPPPPDFGPAPQAPGTLRTVGPAIGGGAAFDPPDNWCRVKPDYRFGGDAVRFLFSPIHQMDLKWRYHFWHLNLKWM